MTWDDHEFANNTWSGGAQNHNREKGEGEWLVRRAAAARAYYEWMPIREDAQTLTPRVYRTFRFGDLATLFMLDTRVIGRDEQVLRDDVSALDAQRRSILGAAQEHWLAGEFAESVRAGALWNVLGQQVPQSEPGMTGGNPDSWDGYRAARERMFDAVDQTRLGNLAVLTGDVHSSWAYDLPRRPLTGYDASTGRGSLGVELVGTSVSSPSSLGAGPNAAKRLTDIRATRPHLRYVDGSYRGYFVLDLTRERLQADYYAVATILDRSTKERFEKGFITESGRNHLIESSSAASPANAPEPAP